jgi:hypothetical protein
VDICRRLLPPLAAGCLAGLLAVAGLLATNTGSLRDLILHAQDGWLAAALLTFGFAGTFGSAAVGLAVMQAGSDEE